MKKTTKKKAITKTKVAKTEPVKKVTYRDFVEDKFFEIVLRVPKVKITPSTTLEDFVPKKDKIWASEYVSMFCDRVEMELSPAINIKARIKHISKKPLSEIIDYLTKIKNGTVFHGWK